MAQPGRLRESLHAILLNASETSRIEVVGQTHGGPSVQRIIAEVQPTLVVLEYDLMEEAMPEGVECILSEPPPPHFLILASNTYQQQAALAQGADKVLLKGFTVAELFKVIGEIFD